MPSTATITRRNDTRPSGVLRTAFGINGKNRLS